MLANRLFAISISLGVLTTLLSILSLSLNYWQGKTLSGSEFIEMVSGSQNIKQSQGYVQRTEGSFGNINDMKNMIFDKTGPGKSPWSDAVFNIHGGIWHLCVHIDKLPEAPAMMSPEVCMYLINAPGVYFPMMSNVWVNADWIVPRAMLFLGMFCTIGCVVCILVRVFVMLEKPILLSIAAGLALVAGVFFMAGFSIFADTMKVEFLNYQSAFYFCILSWLLSWVTGGIIIKTRLSDYDTNVA